MCKFQIKESFMDEQIWKDIRISINHNHRKLTNDYERIEKKLDDDKIRAVVRNAILTYLKNDQEIVLTNVEVENVYNFMFSKKDIRKYLEGWKDDNGFHQDFPKHYTNYERAIDLIEQLLQSHGKDVSIKKTNRNTNFIHFILHFHKSYHHQLYAYIHNEHDL